MRSKNGRLFISFCFYYKKNGTKKPSIYLKMKILVLADRRINESLPDIIKKESIDLVLLLGDLKFIDICDLAEVNIPIVGVYGNHCVSDYFLEIKAENIHLLTTKIKGYKLF